MKLFLLALILLGTFGALYGLLLAGPGQSSVTSAARTSEMTEEENLSALIGLDAELDDGNLLTHVECRGPVKYVIMNTFIPGPSGYQHNAGGRSVDGRSIHSHIGGIWKRQQLLVQENLLGKQCYIRVDLFARRRDAPKDSAYTLVASKLLDIRGRKGQMAPKEADKPEGSGSP